jgi:hypothetical protein
LVHIHIFIPQCCQFRLLAMLMIIFWNWFQDTFKIFLMNFSPTFSNPHLSFWGNLYQLNNTYQFVGLTPRQEAQSLKIWDKESYSYNLFQKEITLQTLYFEIKKTLDCLDIGHCIAFLVNVHSEWALGPYRTEIWSVRSTDHCKRYIHVPSSRSIAPVVTKFAMLTDDTSFT